MWVTRANSWVCERDVIWYTQRIWFYTGVKARVYERRGTWLEKLGGRKAQWFSCFLWFSY